MSLTVSVAQIVAESASPMLVAPDSWSRTRLGDVATILNGHAFKSSQFVADGGTPLIRIRDIRKTSTAVGYAGDYDERYIVHPGDLLVGMDGDFNAARWSGPEALLNQRVCRITPDPELLDLDYLTAVLPGYLQAIHDFTSSTTVTHLSSRDVADIPLPLPSLPEQQAFADLARSASNSVASASSHLNAARVALSNARRAVIAAACTGQLTADWREKHEADANRLAIELQDAAGNRRRKPALPEPEWLDTELPASWGVVTLDWLVDRIEAGKSVQADGQPATADQWGVIKVSAMSWGQFLEQENKAILDTNLINPAYEVRSGDLLISRANTVDLVGATVLVAETRPHLLLSDKSLRLITLPGVDKSWLNYALRSPTARAQFEDRATGTSESMRNLSQPKILQTTLALPPPEEQLEIARRIEAVMATLNKLSAAVQASSKRVDHIFDAVLAKAFRGDLIS